MNNDELLKNYKRGLIDSNEYEKMKEEKSNKKLSLHERLERKLLGEYAHFISELSKKSHTEILDSAYEITCKQEIQDMLCYSDLHDKEIEALLQEDDILTEFYHDWLDDDSALGDSMEYCIKDSIDVVMKCYNKRNKDKEKSNNER